ncbi:MAG TPA: hypothetical protein VKA37_09170, partial [Halobacteriales archaeon]|nr:hypothetical protein [Halobacteriales archaeon]
MTERLDAAPAKHRVAFFDALGFSARPPQAARVPVQYTLATEAPRNVAVRPGTAAVAAADEEVAFHVGEADAFEASPARLTDIVAVRPDDDAVFDHGDVVDGGPTVDLWSGDDRQAHEWFVGDADFLSAGTGDAILVDVEADVDPDVLVESVEWHYYGTRGEDEPEQWWPVDRAAPGPEPRGDAAVRLWPAGPLVEHEVDGVESKWLRCRLPDWIEPTGERSFEVESVDVGGTSGAGTRYPDQLLANDVPQEPDGEEPIRPFGDRPQPGDAFYLRADTALSKADARVTLEFTAHEPSGGTGEPVTDGGTAAAGAAPVRVHGLSSDPDENASEESGTDEITSAAANREAMLAATMEPTTGTITTTTAAVGEPPTGAGGGDPALSWEYWNGGGWSRLNLDEDTTESLTAPETSTVVFSVPDDLEPTTVSGHDGHWIRVRLVGGDYGRTIYAERQGDNQWVRTVEGSPPAFDEITITYEVDRLKSPAHVRTHNNLAAAAHAPDESFQPFAPLPESEQTLYLGFDRPLSGGPLQLFSAVDEHPYPEEFTPRLRWERRRANDPGWTRLDVSDDTAGLTEQGVLGMAFPEPTRATERFGRERHWVRARVTGDEFEPPERERHREVLLQQDLATHGEALGSVVGQTFDLERLADGGSRTAEPCGATVETAPPGGEATRAPPRITGLHFNTGWARNVRVVEDELLGGSDGERKQTFPVSTPPAVDAEVWV